MKFLNTIYLAGLVATTFAAELEVIPPGNPGLPSQVSSESHSVPTIQPSVPITSSSDVSTSTNPGGPIILPSSSPSATPPGNPGLPKSESSITTLPGGVVPSSAEPNVSSSLIESSSVVSESASPSVEPVEGGAIKNYAGSIAGLAAIGVVAVL